MRFYDLHCDLLGCVESDENKLDFTSAITNCCVPQLASGNVSLQTFAVAVITDVGGTQKAERQVELYQKLLKCHKEQVAPFPPNSNRVHGILSIENASGLAEEDEPLEAAFNRLEAFLRVERILYVSLTWNHENRFGGGNASRVGLKPDGAALIEYLSEKGIAIDFSHTSDPLAYDILDLIAKKSLPIPLIASHSNYRAVQDVARNLPDDIAQAIINSGGLIGLNFVRRFVGEGIEAFITHLQHGLSLGGEEAMALGADFYGALDIPTDLLPDITHPTFQEEFGNSSCYPHFFSNLEGVFSKEQLEKLAYRNVRRFLLSAPKAIDSSAETEESPSSQRCKPSPKAH